MRVHTSKYFLDDSPHVSFSTVPRSVDTGNFLPAGCWKRCKMLLYCLFVHITLAWRMTRFVSRDEGSPNACQSLVRAAQSVLRAKRGCGHNCSRGACRKRQLRAYRFCSGPCIDTHVLPCSAHGPPIIVSSSAAVLPLALLLKRTLCYVFFSFPFRRANPVRFRFVF